jgi:hypothetical protein
LCVYSAAAVGARLRLCALRAPAAAVAVCAELARGPAGPEFHDCHDCPCMLPLLRATCHHACEP